MIPRITPAANRTRPMVTILIVTNETGTIFSKKREFFGICDLFFKLIWFAMNYLAKYIDHIVSK
jgi:hypothetical protein